MTCSREGPGVRPALGSIACRWWSRICPATVILAGALDTYVNSGLERYPDRRALRLQGSEEPQLREVTYVARVPVLHAPWSYLRISWRPCRIVRASGVVTTGADAGGRSLSSLQPCLVSASFSCTPCICRGSGSPSRQTWRTASRGRPSRTTCT